MDTLINRQQEHISVQSKTSTATSISKLWEDAESNRFGIIPILLVVLACLGGLAASFGAGSDTLKLAMIVFPTIISLAFMLAVAPMRLIIWVSVFALFFDLLVFIF